MRPTSAPVAGWITPGEPSYGLLADGTDGAAMAPARPQMIATLNSFRDTLAELGGGRGVTDAVSGDEVVDLIA